MRLLDQGHVTFEEAALQLFTLGIPCLCLVAPGVLTGSHLTALVNTAEAAAGAAFGGAHPANSTVSVA